MIELRDALVSRFAALPGVRMAEAHDEDFGEAEIRRVGGKAMPAVYVVNAGAQKIETIPGRDVVADFRWAAVVLATRGNEVANDRASRGDAAAAIAYRVAYELEAGSAFAGQCRRPAKVAVANASTAGTARLGVSAWVVTWTHRAPIRPDDLDLVLADLDLIASTIDPDEGPTAETAAGAVTVLEEDGERIESEVGGEVVAAETI